MFAHSIIAALPRAVLDAAESLGIDAAGVCAAAGVEPAVLEDPDARVPLAVDLAIWQVLSERPVGLELGARLGVAGMGVVGYALQHGSTVGEGLRWLQRYRAVIHPDVMPQIERRADPEGDQAVFHRPVPPPFARLREPVYAQAAGLVAICRALTGRAVRPVAVSFPLTPPEDRRRFEAWFECRVSWGTPLLEVAFPATLLDLPLHRADPGLFGYLARKADELLARLPAETSVAARTRREIGSLLARGESRLPVVARRLGVSERTLHRRLQEEGTTFAALVEEARRERALLLLEDPRVSASEVAFLLGYTEPAPFFRAFRRWTGASPQAWRARTVAAAG